MEFSVRPCGNGLNRVHEVTLDECRDLLRMSNARSHRLTGRRHAFPRGRDPSEELHPDICTKPVRRDHRTGAGQRDGDRYRAHAHGPDMMEERQNQAAPVEHDLAAAGSGSHQRGFRGGLPVEAMQERDAENRGHDCRGYENCDDCAQRSLQIRPAPAEGYPNLFSNSNNIAIRQRRYDGSRFGTPDIRGDCATGGRGTMSAGR